MTVMIGRLDSVVIDCPDPRALAAFYCELLGMHMTHDDGELVVIRTDSDAPPMTFRRTAEPFGLDVRVDDIGTAERRALAAGATLVRESESARVYSDPAGRPFRLIF